MERSAPFRRIRRATRTALTALTSAWRCGILRFAGVVEEHGQVEDVGPRRLLQEGAVFGKGRLGGVDDFVERFDADEGVFVGGVTMEELMLHQAGEGAELGEEAAEEAEFVHGAQGGADLSLAR